jgi:hypothetical protein
VLVYARVSSTYVCMYAHGIVHVCACAHADTGIFVQFNPLDFQKSYELITIKEIVEYLVIWFTMGIVKTLMEIKGFLSLKLHDYY